MSRVQCEFKQYADKIDEILEEFGNKHGQIYEENALKDTLSLVEILQSQAIVPHAKRSPFTEIAQQRKRTKTPPGYKDSGDGDFFVWVDFLTGLLEAQNKGHKFGGAVLVSNDRKTDWQRAGNPHPILIAEVAALTSVPFEIWTLDKLAEQVDHVT